MKIKSHIVAAAVIVAAVAVGQTAEARDLTATDRAIVDKAMDYMGQMATIMEKNADKPKVLLAELDEFIDKKGPEMRRLSLKIEEMEQSLDESAKQQLQQEYGSHKSVERLQKAVLEVLTKQKDNEEFQQEFVAQMMRLEPPRANDVDEKGGKSTGKSTGTKKDSGNNDGATEGAKKKSPPRK